MECNHDQLIVNLPKNNNISFSNCKRNFLDLQPKLNIEKIMQEKFLLLVPESYIEDITIKKLKVLPFLKLKQNEQRVSKFLRKNKLDTLKLDMKIEFSSIAGIYQSVKLNIGVAFIIIPILPNMRGIKCQTFLNLSNSTLDTIYPITNSKSDSTNSIVKFKNFIRLIKSQY